MSDSASIPGVETVHARSVWVDPLYPITGPATPWAAIDTAVVHYTAADDLIDGDPGEHAENLPAYIRAMQKAYVDNRNYSLGYWWAVDWLGGAWQIRGWEFKSAANLDHNDHTGPILVLVDGADSATDEAAHTIRCIIAGGQRRAARSWAIKGHGQLYIETHKGTATACPGRGLQAQVNADVFVPRPPPPPPTPQPTPKGIDMLILDHKPGTPQWTAVTFTGTHLAWLNGYADQVMKSANIDRQTVSDEQMDGIIRSAATTTECPSTWVDTPRGAAWTAQRA